MDSANVWNVRCNRKSIMGVDADYTEFLSGYYKQFSVFYSGFSAGFWNGNTYSKDVAHIVDDHKSLFVNFMNNALQLQKFLFVHNDVQYVFCFFCIASMSRKDGDSALHLFIDLFGYFS